MGRIAEGKSAAGDLALQQLRPWHKAMARTVVASGSRPKDLCRIFDMTPGQISRITASPLFIAERERLEAQAEYEAVDVRTELEMRQGLALKTMDELIEGGNDPKIRKDIALEILDRTGYGKRAEVQKHLHLHAHKEVKEMEDSELEEAVLGFVEGEFEEAGG